MRNPMAGPAGISLVASMVLAGAVLAQSSSRPDPQSQPQAQQGADSAADAANKPKDNKSGTTAKKVYTNDDLKGMHGDDVSVVGNDKAAARPGKTSAANTDKRNEQYWRGRAQRIRNQMADVDRQIAQFNQSNASGTSTTNSTAPSPPGAHTTTSSRPAERLQRLQNRKAELEKQMDQLEEEARKAGVPPGWLR